MVSAITLETMVPARRKGSAQTKYTGNTSHIFMSPLRVNRNSSARTTAMELTSAMVPSFLYNEPAHPETTYEKTPPAPRPNSAIEMAKKAKW